MRICFPVACVVAGLAALPVHAQSDSSAQMSFAAAEGDLRVVTRLLDAGFAVNTRWAPHDHFALLKAAEWGHVEVVRLLLARGADPKLKDNAGRTARWWAVNNDHRAVVRILAEAEGIPAAAGQGGAAPTPPAPARAPTVRPAEPPARPPEPARPVPRADAGPELPPPGVTPRD
ncbi:MAG: ankyrin repeat domain-containing protein, partial [Gemmatirosa sp.]